MNQTYLMRHIAYHLHTFVKRYSHNFQLLESFCARLDFQDDLTGEEVVRYFRSMKELPVFPVLLTLNNQIAYAWVPVSDACYIAGPVRFSSPVFLNFQLKTDSLPKEWLDTVPLCGFSDLIGDTLLIFNLFRKDILEETELINFNCIQPGTEDKIQKHFSDMVFENREYEKKHNPHDQEIREFSSIETGDLERLKHSMSEDYIGEIGTLARTPLRHARNLGIVLITLASRSAIRGGVHPEIAYSLSDSYIQEIEDSTDAAKAIHIAKSAEFHYAQLVNDLLMQKQGLQNKKKNPHINKCKDYIFAHLHGKITVQDIADELGINANYLSELFLGCEGITITQYVQNEKIKLVKNMLTYSHYSYIEIAAYLGYSSQSHLGKHFKQATGYTLSQYRKFYGKY